MDKELRDLILTCVAILVLALAAFLYLDAQDVAVPNFAPPGYGGR